MVSVIGSGFRYRIDAFDSTLYCYSDPIAENHLNALENTKTLDEKHIVSFRGDRDSTPTHILETVHRRNWRQFTDIFEDSSPINLLYNMF